MIKDEYITWLANNLLILLAFSLAHCLVAGTALFLNGFTFLEGYGISLLFMMTFFGGYCGAMLVVGFQAINPMCPKTRDGFMNLYRVCEFFLVFSGIAVLMAVAAMPNMFTAKSDEYLAEQAVNMFPALIGLIYGTARICEKYVFAPERAAAEAEVEEPAAEG